MPRLMHGAIITTGDMERASAELSQASRDIPLAFTLVQPVKLDRFDFLFLDLQKDANNLLPEGPTTVNALKVLGRTMVDVGPTDPTNPGDSPIPAAYTYFGQFVDHDISFEARSAELPELLDPNLAPLTVNDIRQTLRNVRTATLDLDNVYSVPAPRDPADVNRMLLGRVSPSGLPGPPGVRPPGKGDDNDVPREPRSSDPVHDRAALIGDPRNDENTIVAQLQVAFLKAHNALVAQGRDFEEAQRILRQHYQHLVLHDYLMRVCDPSVVADILQTGPKVFDPAPGNFFMPLEFSVAAYRFGHTMVRNAYNFNVNFNLRGGIPATLDLLFTFSALSGQIGGEFEGGQLPEFDTLPENWIIEWENIVDLVDVGGVFDKARRIDTKLSEGLFQLRNITGQEEADDGASLSVRNLLRGYLLRMPTGQAVAKALGIPPLGPSQLQAAAGSPQQAQALQAGGFLDRTPLWYYVLAEASAAGGNHLGRVGSTLVADVMIGLVRRSDDSILNTPGWQPTLPSLVPRTFKLRDLLAFAGVLPGVQIPPLDVPDLPTVGVPPLG
jgi:hypothetical protein